VWKKILRTEERVTGNLSLPIKVTTFETRYIIFDEPVRTAGMRLCYNTNIMYEKINIVY
jgi:hypothetical protein